MINITNKGKNELSLIMFNDEYFYNELKYSTLATKDATNYVKQLLTEEYIYTEAQLKKALEDMADYLKDM